MIQFCGEFKGLCREQDGKWLLLPTGDLCSEFPTQAVESVELTKGAVCVVKDIRTLRRFFKKETWQYVKVPTIVGTLVTFLAAAFVGFSFAELAGERATSTLCGIALGILVACCTLLVRILTWRKRLTVYDESGHWICFGDGSNNLWGKNIKYRYDD